MAHTVLIISDTSDAVAERVAVELIDRGVPVTTMNTADFPSLISIAARIETGSEGWSGVIDTPRGEVALANVGAIYLRRPTQFKMDERMSSPERAFAYSEARYGFGGVLTALRQSGALWVNDPMAAMRAEYKPVQLATAARIGLRIPRTIITSNSEEAYAWAENLGKAIVYKPLAGIWHADEGKIRVVYTTPIKNVETLRNPDLGRTAQMFQEWIDKEYEARAIVVGNEVLAVRIDSSSERGRTDWRSDYDSLTYERIDLPADLRNHLVELHDRLGLVFGAVDLVHGLDGHWYFLETNQTGEWGWLHLRTGLPVPMAMADVLQKGPAWSR